MTAEVKEAKQMETTKEAKKLIKQKQINCNLCHKFLGMWIIKTSRKDIIVCSKCFKEVER